ncbi:uncharacterized protein LOC129599046 [Paramacrobiotus metropolitanus]|uniref:uncharacterized protein LOC129599046 n=1 Tax=Paramacrobiotus metropolitanus TaxID=2943436 RepID=UPI002445A641|nr:uncharacterized protein LOC129599046 [Paramacrobiotus metropolitanus]
MRGRAMTVELDHDVNIVNNVPDGQLWIHSIKLADRGVYACAYFDKCPWESNEKILWCPLRVGQAYHVHVSPQGTPAHVDNGDAAGKFSSVNDTQNSSISTGDGTISPASFLSTNWSGKFPTNDSLLELSAVPTMGSGTASPPSNNASRFADTALYLDTTRPKITEPERPLVMGGNVTDTDTSLSNGLSSASARTTVSTTAILEEITSAVNETEYDTDYD